MSGKIHQVSTTEYQIRVDGKPVHFPSQVDKVALDQYLALCAENPDCYVDVVSVRTQVLFSQHTYHQMEKHFLQKSLKPGTLILGPDEEPG